VVLVSVSFASKRHGKFGFSGESQNYQTTCYSPTHCYDEQTANIN